MNICLRIILKIKNLDKYKILIIYSNNIKIYKTKPKINHKMKVLK